MKMKAKCVIRVTLKHGNTSIIVTQLKECNIDARILKKWKEVKYHSLKEEACTKGFKATDDEIFYNSADGHDSKNRVFSTGDAARSIPRQNRSEARRRNTSSFRDSRDEEIANLKKQLEDMQQQWPFTIKEEVEKIIGLHGHLPDNKDNDGLGI